MAGLGVSKAGPLGKMKCARAMAVTSISRKTWIFKRLESVSLLGNREPAVAKTTVGLLVRGRTRAVC